MERLVYSYALDYVQNYFLINLDQTSAAVVWCIDSWDTLFVRIPIRI